MGALSSKPISWQEKAASKRADTLTKIPKKWRLSPAQLDTRTQRDITGPFIQQFLTPDEVAITSLESTQLVQAIREGSLTSVEVTKAFCKSAAIAHQFSNCLLEITFESALERARYLDAYLLEHKKPIGPLHGLPISLKDQFHIKGVDTTMGYIGWIGGNMNVDESLFHQVESQIVTDLLSAGAVIHCKTTVPQTLMLGETENNITGYTWNPRNRQFTCGGSSGGEAVLQALGGSSLGFGTDIGGSIRIPASYCGIFGLKPHPDRITYRNATTTNPGQNVYKSTIGPMSTSLDGLKLGLEALLATEPWLRDPHVSSIPFRQDIIDTYLSRTLSDGSVKQNHTPLKLAFLWDDGYTRPHPPITRAMQLLFDAAAGAGHKVTDWQRSSSEKLVDTHASILFADSGADVRSHLARSGEPVQKTLAGYAKDRPAMDLLEYQALTLEAHQHETEFSDSWNATAVDDGQTIDAIVMPVTPSTAHKPSKFYKATYTTLANMLNYTCIVLPVTRVDRTIDMRPEGFVARNKSEKRCWDDYDPEAMHGSPVGIQIMCRKFEEEKAWAIAKIISAALETKSTLDEKPS